MRIIVNDSSALIDLKKGGLLEILVKLPFQFVIADSIVADELLSFSRGDVSLMRRHMSVTALNERQMKQVAELQANNPALSMHDCMSLVIAQGEPGCVLLTGDRRLRAKAEAVQIECHGVLWIVEEMTKAHVTSPRTLLRALETWRGDSTIRLPSADLNNVIARLRRNA
jgi:predicted nucleic acid-binding protein